MPKTDFITDGGKYATVAERITLFYERYPNGRIITDLVERTAKEVVFRSSVYRAQGDTVPAATGWAAEREGDGDINLVACLENTETSAIGRALANLGFTASANRPSLEEMERATQKRAAIKSRQVREPAQPGNSSPGSSRALRIDSLELLAQARKLGFGQERVRVLQRAIRDPAVAGPRIARIEIRLRSWVRSHGGTYREARSQTRGSLRLSDGTYL